MRAFCSSDQCLQDRAWTRADLWTQLTARCLFIVNCIFRGEGHQAGRN